MQVVFGLTLAHQWAIAAKALPVAVPPELEQLLAVPPEQAAEKAVHLSRGSNPRPSGMLLAPAASTR